MKYLKLFYSAWFIISTNNLLAIGLADFVPNFLAGNEIMHESNYENQSSHPAIKRKNSEVVRSSNCKNGSFAIRSSVFCTGKTESNVTMSDDNTGIKSGADQIGTNSSRLSPNKGALQSEDLKSALSKYNSSYMLSIQPKSTIDFGVGISDKKLNSFQFNLRY